MEVFVASLWPDYYDVFKKCCVFFLNHSEVGSPTNLVTSDVTENSFVASWTAAPGNVRLYRVTWKSLFSEEAGEKTVPGDITTTVLDGLTPETRYKVSVYAAYSSKEGEPLHGEETTDGKSIPACVMKPAYDQTLFTSLCVSEVGLSSLCNLPQRGKKCIYCI